jgi:hypothetical protein
MTGKADPGEASSPEAPGEGRPGGAVLAVPDREPKDLAVARGADPCRDGDPRGTLRLAHLAASFVVAIGAKPWRRIDVLART